MNAPKFLELNLNENTLDFTGLSPDGNTYTLDWPIDLDRHTYRMSLDGAGFVALEADRAGGWLGLNFDFSHSMGVGSWWAFRDGQLSRGPYLKYNPRLHIKRNIFLEAEGWLMRDPMGTVGIGYEF